MQELTSRPDKNKVKFACERIFVLSIELKLGINVLLFPDLFPLVFKTLQYYVDLQHSEKFDLFLLKTFLIVPKTEDNLVWFY